MDDVLPTPDELLLEVMDLVQLAFPAAVRDITITMVENEDGRRPALKDLDARGARDAPQRPDLGHPDGEVLDAINHLLSDLADATERTGGMRVHNGTLSVTSDDDGARNIVLLGNNGDRMERRFDKSELRWLLYTDSLFAALNQTEQAEQLMRKRTAAALDGTTRFDIDMVTGTITFSNPNNASTSRVFSFELLGSHVKESGRFLWGFANEAAPARVKSRVDAIRRAATASGLRMFSEGSFSCPPLCAERLARHTAVQLQADGAYVAPFVGRTAEHGDKTSGFMVVALFAN